MHPAGPSRCRPPARRIRLWRLLTVAPLLCTAAATGCGGPDLSAQLTGDEFDRETAVFDRISALDFAALSRAYERLDSLSYRLDTETRQLTSDGRVVASESRRLQMSPGGGSVEHVTAHGDLEDGFMSFAVSADSIPDQSRDLIDLWVPEEPVFASARNREYYRYLVRPDTVIAGDSCHVFEVRVLDGVTAEKMPVRRVRLAAARSDDALRWIRIRRRDDALFYSERSMLELEMRGHEAARLLPVRREVSVAVDAPLRRTHFFGSTQTYTFDLGSGLSR